MDFTFNILKIFAVSICLVLSTALWANENNKIGLNDLQNGDVLLISLNCMQCRYIESETNAPFSHSGIILETALGLKVAQALGTVHLTDIKKFLKPVTPNSKVIVVRSRESDVNEKFKILLKIFEQKFANLPFDGNYLWNNFDNLGNEKIYCSELILKLLNEVLEKKLQPEILSYEKHYDYWFKVFRGVVPANEIGNSPASFYKDQENFEIVGQLIY